MKTDKNPLLRTIGIQIRKLRIINNKSTKEIASVLNITTQAYGNIERGETAICVTKLILLAAYYKILVIELFPEEYRGFIKNVSWEIN